MRLLKSAMPVFAAFLGGMVGSLVLFGMLQAPSHAGVGTSPGLKHRVEVLEVDVDDLFGRVVTLENFHQQQ